MKDSAKIKVRDYAILAVCAAVLLVVQVGLAFLPNIELVSLLIMIYAKSFGKKVFWIIHVFVFLEGIIYGFGIWWINYLYVWSILAGVVLLLKKQESIWIWALVAGFFGLLFGAFCAIPYFFAGGIGAGFAYWVSGIPYDILHCIGNIVVCIALYRPISRILPKLYKTA